MNGHTVYNSLKLENSELRRRLAEVEGERDRLKEACRSSLLWFEVFIGEKFDEINTNETMRLLTAALNPNEGAAT